MILFNNPLWSRSYSDIDILVEASQATSTYQFFVYDLDFSIIGSSSEQKAYPILFQHYAPLLSKNEIGVDMHHRLTQESDGYHMNYERIFRDMQRRFFSDTIQLPIPSLEDILLNLCYHQFQHEYITHIPLNLSF